MEKKFSDASRNLRSTGSPRSQVILVFARAPLIGRVKTRLAPELDPERILHLYKCFVVDTLNLVRQAGYPFCICFDPPDAGNIMRDWLGDAMIFQAQDGNDIGEKMANAFLSAFASNVERAVIIGTDTPDLPSKFIDRAFSAMTEHDAVLGPAKDGGYYLIGFRNDTFRQALFKNIPWSTPSVYPATMKRLSDRGASVYQLPKWRDIDHYADLRALAGSLVLTKSMAPTTAAFLKESGICGIPNRPR